MFMLNSNYGVKHYNLDNEDDLKNLDLENNVMGTTCFVIETSNYYMLNSKKEWVQVEPYLKSAEGREI